MGRKAGAVTVSCVGRGRTGCWTTLALPAGHSEKEGRVLGPGLGALGLSWCRVVLGAEVDATSASQRDTSLGSRRCGGLGTCPCSAMWGVVT